MCKLCSRTTTIALLALLGALVPRAARANVNLEWRLEQTGPTPIGQVVRVGLYAVSDSAVDQAFAGADVIVTWDPMRLQMSNIDNNGPYQWQMSGFPFQDPFGLNEWPIPQDGNLLYIAQGDFTPPAATPAGLLMTTFVLKAMAPTCGTVISILDMAGSPPTQTIVWSGQTPGVPVTGTLGSVAVPLATPPCALGDLNCDGFSDGADVAPFIQALLDPVAYHATFPNCDIGQADLNGDGVIDPMDVPVFVSLLLGG